MFAGRLTTVDPSLMEAITVGPDDPLHAVVDVDLTART
jgi:hypothetical protein